jgi:hypothetical protein
MKRLLSIALLLAFAANIADGKVVARGHMFSNFFDTPVNSGVINSAIYTDIRVCVNPNSGALYHYTATVMGVDPDGNNFPIADIPLTTNASPAGSVTIHFPPDQIRILIKFDRPGFLPGITLPTPVETTYAVWGRY